MVDGYVPQLDDAAVLPGEPLISTITLG